MADGKVVFQIDGDARGVKTTIKDVTNDIEKESKKWDNAVKDSTDKGEGFFKGMLKGIAGAISAAGIAKLILDWGKAAIQAASDLQEVQNVVDVTFGDSARQIQTWSEAAGKQYGLTETQAKRYASTIGAMLKSQGTAQKDVLEMSESLAGLAADMASFYNLDFDTAFEKIRAGISGETEPLKQLGVNMSVANLEAFALEQGITKSYAAMSQGEQTLLRYQYLMKATADAQGDFARTSDGFANATRRVEASLETIKTKGGTLLMTVIAPITEGIASAMEEFTKTNERTVLDDFDDITKDISSRMYEMEKTYIKAKSIVDMMIEMQAKNATLANGTQISFDKLFGNIGSVEANGGDIKKYIGGLGLDVDSTVQSYKVWQEAIKQLTSSIPTLTSVIDAETGAINGGTAAINDHVEEFRKGKEKELAWAAYYAKARALKEKEGSLYLYQFNASAAEQAVKNIYDLIEQKYGDYFQYSSTGAFETGQILGDWLTINGFGFGSVKKMTDEQKAAYEELQRLVLEYVDAVTAAENAQDEYNSQAESFVDAEEQLTAGYQALLEKYGEGTDVINESGDAWVDYGKKSKEAWTTSTEAAKTALKSLADYAQGVHDATAQTVDGIVKGFAVLERPTTALEEKRSKLIEQQNELNRSTRDGAKRYEELQAQIDELNKSLDEYSPKGMQDALQSQLAFMDEYIKNLEKAQQMGLSNDLLASLSDGSVQSAEYLASLVASPDQAKEVDALFQQVQAKKNEFTNALTDQKLTVDETYQGMVETAKAAIDDMRMGADASEATAETVQGMIDGLKSKMPALSDEIDAILAELSRLSGFGISFDINSVSSRIGGALLGNNTTITPHETGLDYVPFDGYLASLHEGESILTAEENRIWQRFKNGSAPQSMDYDALGATMRDNVQAGGNVYLDGKTVGRVISDQQGNAYRQLQRSGWQQ